MKHGYDSFDYWQSVSSENATIRGQNFMNVLPNNKTVYFHSLIFSKNTGLSNVWSYFPNEMVLLGYIQYSFLQEAFYQWINCKDELISYIPPKSVENIIKDGLDAKKITKEEANNMKRHVEMLKRCWHLPKNRIMMELNRFARDFNRTWYGDHREFLYIKVFKSPEELGEFVINSSYMSSCEDDFINKTGKTVDEWLDICQRANSNKCYGKEFRKILYKRLTEII